MSDMPTIASMSLINATCSVDNLRKLVSSADCWKNTHINNYCDSHDFALQCLRFVRFGVGAKSSLVGMCTDELGARNLSDVSNRLREGCGKLRIIDCTFVDANVHSM